MVNHSGQFERVKGLFSNVFDAGKAVDVVVTETPRANCRCRAEGDKGTEKAGSIRLHADYKGGTVYNERTRWCASWREDAGRKLSREERRRQNIQWAVSKAEKEERERREISESQFTASMILRECKPVTSHPYLTKKRIKPTSTMFVIDARAVDAIASERGIRNDQGGMWRTGLSGRLLVIPLIKDGVLSSLQFIDANGKKRFMRTGRVGGAYWLSCPIEVYQASNRIGIAEGVATALSVEMVEGYPCVASMSSGNLVNVAVSLARKFPDKAFVILSDVGNGEEDAKKAGQAIGVPPVKPIFTEELIKAFQLATGSKDTPTDWNDFCIAIGAL